MIRINLKKRPTPSSHFTVPPHDQAERSGKIIPISSTAGAAAANPSILPTTGRFLKGGIISLTKGPRHRTRPSQYSRELRSLPAGSPQTDMSNAVLESKAGPEDGFLTVIPLGAALLPAEEVAGPESCSFASDLANFMTRRSHQCKWRVRSCAGKVPSILPSSVSLLVLCSCITRLLRPRIPDTHDAGAGAFAKGKQNSQRSHQCAGGGRVIRKSAKSLCQGPGRSQFGHKRRNRCIQS